MPKFTLIKHADSQYDAEVRMDFDSEVVDLAQAHFHDFLQASGFELPVPEEKDVFNPRLTNDDWLALAEDQMWDDAFESKFGIQATRKQNLDGILGGDGADVIEFPYK